MNVFLESTAHDDRIRTNNSILGMIDNNLVKIRWISITQLLKYKQNEKV